MNKDCFDGCDIIKCPNYGQDLIFPPKICLKDPIIDRFKLNKKKTCNKCENFNITYICKRCIHYEQK